VSNIVDELKNQGAVEVPQAEQTAIAKKREPNFRERSLALASQVLVSWVGEDRAREAAGRVSVALQAARTSAKDPKDFDECTIESIGRVIAIASLTAIMPSTGATALAYAIPRRPRKGEAPQLTYMLSHRGINALANRAGMHMVAIPISYADKVKVTETGEVVIEDRDIDNPPTNENELRGVMLLVKQLATGNTICQGWVPKKLILARREQSDGYRYAEKNEWAKESDPWHKWFTEQAMKTAMHYAIGRGWCVIDDTESVKALSADVESDIIDGEVVSQRRIGGLVKNDLPTE